MDAKAAGQEEAHRRALMIAGAAALGKSDTETAGGAPVAQMGGKNPNASSALIDGRAPAAPVPGLGKR